MKAIAVVGPTADDEAMVITLARSCAEAIVRASSAVGS